MNKFDTESFLVGIIAMFIIAMLVIALVGCAKPYIQTVNSGVTWTDCEDTSQSADLKARAEHRAEFIRKNGFK
jgi:hypothetical protein